MASKELVPVSEEVRFAMDEKPEIHWERRHGLEIFVYYLRALGTVSMRLALDGFKPDREFTVPNDRVNDAIKSPEAYADYEGMSRAEVYNQETPIDDGA